MYRRKYTASHPRKTQLHFNTIPPFTLWSPQSPGPTKLSSQNSVHSSWHVCSLFPIHVKFLHSIIVTIQITIPLSTFFSLAYPYNNFILTLSTSPISTRTAQLLNEAGLPINIITKIKFILGQSTELLRRMGFDDVKLHAFLTQVLTRIAFFNVSASCRRLSNSFILAQHARDRAGAGTQTTAVNTGTVATPIPQGRDFKIHNFPLCYRYNSGDISASVQKYVLQTGTLYRRSSRGKRSYNLHKMNAIYCPGTGLFRHDT